MSSGSFRDRGGIQDRGRGGFRGGGAGGGRGGYKARRYWDNDDFDRRDRRRSRSRSRSSRSYSRSRSRSRSPDTSKKMDEYQTKSVDVTTAIPASNPIATPLDNYASSGKDRWDQVTNPYQMTGVGVPQNGQQYGSLDTKYPLGYGEKLSSMPTAMTYGFGYGTTYQGEQYMQPALTTPAAPPAPIISDATNNLVTESSKKKKKKESKKKKKKRKTSSSSSSSTSSSDESSKNKHKKKSKRKSRRSEESSDSSSQEEKKSKSKSTPTSVALTPQQKTLLEKQKEGYKSKILLLDKEINRLKIKEYELMNSKADRKLIEENLKLQADLKGRCKAVHIVIEKIDVVLAGGNAKAPPPPSLKQTPAPPPVVAVNQGTKIPMAESGKNEEKTLNLDFYDAGQYWCRLCNVFPETLVAMLDHFHGKEHEIQIEQLGIEEKPWHKGDSLKETKPEPGAKKIPFRGIQFFSPVSGWYCRLCSKWMGDHHCATEHLKGVDHNRNLMNFVEEHPEWESKWLRDRENAFKRASQDTVRKSRFDSASEKKVKSIEMVDENAKSIHVQMRNNMPTKEEAPHNFVSANVKDNTVDEWMGKPPKVNIDIDTQKFAAIVREKHGAQKEKESSKKSSSESKTSHSRDRDRDRDHDRRGDSRKQEPRVELTLSSSRKDDRERERNRDTRGRRRSRSRSRSKDKDRGKSTRDRRDRSRSKERDRDKKKEKVETKETVKRLPLIGKMPLYKRPAAFTGKEKDSSSVDGPTSSRNISEYGPVVPSLEPPTNHRSSFVEQAMKPAALDNTASGYDHSDNVNTLNSENFESNTSSRNISSTRGASEYMYERSDYSALPVASYEDLKPPGEKETPTTGTSGTALPDDLQQALDLIYAGGTAKPGSGGIPFPPPGIPPVDLAPNAIPDTSSNNFDSEYGNSSNYNYSEYDQQNSFEGYAPMFDEVDEGPPGVDVPQTKYPSTSHQVSRTPAAPLPKPADADEIEDLRMLGIDIDDTTAVLFK